MPLLAFVIAPLMVSFFAGSPRLMVGSPPPESAVMVIGAASEMMLIVSVLSEVSRVMADTWAAGMFTVEVPFPLTNPARAGRRNGHRGVCQGVNAAASWTLSRSRAPGEAVKVRLPPLPRDRVACPSTLTVA